MQEAMNTSLQFHVRALKQHLCKLPEHVGTIDCFGCCVGLICIGMHAQWKSLPLISQSYDRPKSCTSDLKKS